MTTKYVKSENFIGWTSPDGRLKVIGVYKVDPKYNESIFKVTCEVCKQDTELFPEGYFIARKGNLLRGGNPCGCSKGFCWNPEQFIIIAKRKIKDRFIIHGYAEPFHGNKTKVICECTLHNYKWETTLNALVSDKKLTGCKMCMADKQRVNMLTPEDTIIKACIQICKDNNYIFLGFPNGYTGVKSKVQYMCLKHGTVNTNCDNLLRGRYCRKCWTENRPPSSEGFYGYYKERDDELDFLYILNFNNDYIKIGRSFNVKQRITMLKWVSGCSNVKIITFYKGVHKDIYTLEQEIHRRLRGLGYEHLESSWSIETFKIECIPILRELIISCCTDLNIKTPYAQDEELKYKPDLRTYHWSEISDFINDMLK